MTKAMNKYISRGITAAVLGIAISTGAFAQQTKSATKTAPTPQTFDRRIAPTPAPTPELKVPTWTKTTISDGAELVVSEKHTLPLVSFQINFVGGADQFEAADKAGLATLVSSMMSEGTTTRTGDQLASDLQLLGTNISTAVLSESGRIAFTSTKEKFAPTLAVLADVLENPRFPNEALDRQKANAVQSLRRVADRTGAIANIAFPKILYGNDHPYGRSPDTTSIKSITRDDIVSFYKSYFQPGRAIITVVGDVKPDEVKQTIDKALSGWARGGSMPTFNYPAVPAPKSTAIYLIDKPGAAQSTFALGEVGPARDTPDYYALRVMNEMLGVLFQSRLNHNIREVKGYSYGVFSNFSFGRGPGPFRAGGDVVTAKSDSALIEFMKELRDIRGPRPPSDEELRQAKASLVQSLPASFASVGGVNANIGSIYTQGLPEDYFRRFANAVNAVTKDDVVRVAQKYIDPEHMALLIVGDRSKIEGPLAATKIAPIVI
ncbi:MAG TPA: pitrilysin family protein, partial [Gemmatimonadaceae bacterium]